MQSARDFCQLGLPLDLGDYVAGNQLARTATAKARRDQGIRVAGRKIIAGQLEHHVSIVGKVRIERADHPVAIAPGIGPFGVDLEAIGIRIMCQIEPVLTPTLSVLRIRQQAIDEPFIGIRALIAHESRDFIGGWRKPDQVKRDPPDQGRTIRLGCVRHFQLFELCQDESINRILDPRRFMHVRKAGVFYRLVGPVLALLGRKRFGRCQSV
jgi:hypothetical protein